MSGILSTIGLDQLCVADTQAYVDILCKLLTDNTYRNAMRQKLEPPALRMTSVFNPKRGASHLAKVIKRLQIDQHIEPAATSQAAVSFDSSHLNYLVYYDDSFHPEDWCVGSRVQGKFTLNFNTEQFNGEIISKIFDETGME